MPRRRRSPCFDPGRNQLVFEVAAGEQGQGVIGLAIAPDQGIAGYVFTTGQPLALSEVERDARFGRGRGRGDRLRAALDRGGAR